MQRHRSAFGKYVLDSLSVGMYSHPLMALREYIQNSADAIDDRPGSSEAASIHVRIDGRRRSLTICDDGVGIACDKARSTLLNVGCSAKDPAANRGFRGVGRLGGLGYCDELTFSTKSQGEDWISVCTWDCKTLRRLIGDSSRLIDAQTLIEDISRFEQQKHSGSPDDHFFTVEMNAIQDGRNQLLNVPAIKSYLSQVAPVPFHPDFDLGHIVDDEMATSAASYRAYRLLVNGEQIYKPYRDDVTLSRGTSESVKHVSFFDLTGESGLLALGWMADLNLHGTISASTCMDALRLRHGNIMIGDRETLSGFFRERRFNNYLMGEIHMCGSLLIPNSRRDDFEESRQKDEFLTAFIREIGVPLSSRIRHLSNERSKANNSSNTVALFETASRVIKHGYISSAHKEHIVRALNAVNGDGSSADSRLAAELLAGVNRSQDFLSVMNADNHSADHTAGLLVQAIEIAYGDAATRGEADRMIEAIYGLASERC